MTKDTRTPVTIKFLIVGMVIGAIVGVLSGWGLRDFDETSSADFENLKVDMCAESYAAGMADAKAIMNAYECMILEFPDSNGMYAFKYDVNMGRIAEGWGINVPSGDVVDICAGIDNYNRCINKTFSVSARNCFE